MLVFRPVKEGVKKKSNFMLPKLSNAQIYARAKKNSTPLQQIQQHPLNVASALIPANWKAYE
jgi:hypothetical protein